MKLLTQEIIKKLTKFPLYSQENEGENSVVICKFFMPIGGFTWYVTEGNKQEDGDFIFFGLVINNYGEKEYGYFSLNELEAVIIKPSGLRVERDLYFSSCMIKDLC